MTYNHYRHIIFDFDETLATLLIDWSYWDKAVLELLGKYGELPPADTQLNMYHIHQYIERYGKQFRDDFVTLEQRIEKEQYRGYQPIAPSLAFLHALHEQGKQLYLLTSNCRATIEPILEELGIKTWFHTIVTVDDVENLKPTQAPWKLIGNAHSDKAEYLMVGDSTSDSGFARNNEIAYLHVDEIPTLDHLVAKDKS